MENKTEINIVDLIEKNPITRIPNINNHKLINKIKNNFTNYQQQLFLASFYCYINYNPKTDFVIDLDNFWEWIGFSAKDKAKRLLIKSFIKDIDYIIMSTPKGEQKSQGGHNREIIMLTIRTFKSFCLKAFTQKADEIHEYFLKLEEIIHDVIEEENNELKKQLNEKDELLKKEQIKSLEDKKQIKEKTLLEKFPKNTQSIYYGIVDNKTEINIVDLIEKNPITKIPNINNDKLINKIKNNFTDYQQQLFLASFYCYINYNPKTDFVIDLDNIWKWLGFSQKDSSKRVLTKNFTKDIDYKLLPCQLAKQNNKHGGHNKEIIKLNIDTFKKFCLKAGTKKADEIHEYFLKLEEIIHDVIEEENNELKKQLNEKDEIIKKEQIKSIEDKKKIKENTLLEQFPKNTQSIYYGIVDNKSTKGETLIKFGHSNDLRSRVDLHKKTYDNFILINAFKVQNKIHIENEIKNHSTLKSKRRNILIDNRNYTELLAIDDFTFEEIDNMIKTIIIETEYNIENYNKLLEKNEELELLIKKYSEENKVLIEKNILLENNLKEFIPYISKEEKISNVNQINPNTNEIISSYESIEEARNKRKIYYKIYYQKNKDKIIKRANQRLIELKLKNPNIFSEYRKNAYNNIKNKKSKYIK